MKKLLIIFSVIISIFVYTTSVIHSQGQSAFDKAYQEYSLDAETYRQARQEYLLARSQYLRFKTLTAQNTAKEKTAEMLIARDEVVVSYILALKERIAEIKGVPDATRDGVNIRLDDEVNWFNEHKGRVTSAASLDDLVADSDEAKERYELIEPLLYEALSVIASGRVRQYNRRLKDSFTSVSDLISQIREEEREEYTISSRKQEIIDRWIFDTEGRILRSEEKLAEADSLITEFPSLKRKGSTHYNDVLEVLGESRQYLKEASLFVKEIIREIKTQD